MAFLHVYVEVPHENGRPIFPANKDTSRSILPTRTCMDCSLSTDIFILFQTPHAQMFKDVIQAIHTVKIIKLRTPSKASLQINFLVNVVKLITSTENLD